jgi:hypothetical protein
LGECSNMEHRMRDACSQAYDMTLRELDVHEDDDPIAIFVASRIREIGSSDDARDAREISEEALNRLHDVLHST